MIISINIHLLGLTFNSKLFPVLISDTRVTLPQEATIVSSLSQTLFEDNACTYALTFNQKIFPVLISDTALTLPPEATIMSFLDNSQVTHQDQAY